ncbi:chorismate synthase [Methanoregula sp.]|uniref:chorismate synthase n=1 Tax=Methanoregula sp. TaxID=2052170 RepID=UPI002D0622EC|nr:chorismate synthase [Methanoregula sp.]HVP95913.1 chorismate synthase [Methanoregula sp.]
MNTFGKNFRITTFGESHGPAVGCIIDGCPARLALSTTDIQPLLDRRRPGTSPLVSARDETDTVEILSGVCEGKTTGAPVALLVRNQNMHSHDYEAIREKFRPGHADFTYQAKYGIRDYRGGGRSSGRETVGRVAAGAVALKFLAGRGIAVTGRILSVHNKTDPDKIAAEIIAARAAGDSVGGIAEILATGCPVGLGDPVFGKLDAAIAGAMMGIGAVKGVEIGDGFAVAAKFGSENNDQMTAAGFKSNHAGGILGGISSGQDIVVRIAVKPTPSIAKVQQTRDIHGNATEIRVGGRHDPCIVPRILPVAEAMLALVITDAVLEQEKYR